MAESQRTSSSRLQQSPAEHAWVPDRDAESEGQGGPRFLHCRRCGAHGFQAGQRTFVEPFVAECVSEEPDPEQEGGEDPFFLTGVEARTLVVALDLLLSQPMAGVLSAFGVSPFSRVMRLRERLALYP